MSIVTNLRDSIHLFKDESAYSEFCSMMLHRGPEDELRLLTDQGRTLCAVVDLERAKQIAYEHLHERIAERPEVLQELVDALDDDDLVDG